MPSPATSAELLVEATIRTCCLRLEQWAKNPPASLAQGKTLTEEQLKTVLAAAAFELRRQLLTA